MRRLSSWLVLILGVLLLIWVWRKWRSAKPVDDRAHLERVSFRDPVLTTEGLYRAAAYTGQRDYHQTRTGQHFDIVVWGRTADVVRSYTKELYVFLHALPIPTQTSPTPNQTPPQDRPNLSTDHIKDVLTKDDQVQPAQRTGSAQDPLATFAENELKDSQDLFILLDYLLPDTPHQQANTNYRIAFTIDPSLKKNQAQIYSLAKSEPVSAILTMTENTATGELRYWGQKGTPQAAGNPAANPVNIIFTKAPPKIPDIKAKAADLPGQSVVQWTLLVVGTGTSDRNTYELSGTWKYYAGEYGPPKIQF